MDEVEVWTGWMLGRFASSQYITPPWPHIFTVGKACAGFYHEEVTYTNKEGMWRVAVLSLRVFCRHYFIIKVLPVFRWSYYKSIKLIRRITPKGSHDSLHINRQHCTCHLFPDFLILSWQIYSIAVMLSLQIWLALFGSLSLKFLMDVISWVLRCRQIGDFSYVSLMKMILLLEKNILFTCFGDGALEGIITGFFGMLQNGTSWAGFQVGIGTKGRKGFVKLSLRVLIADGEFVDGRIVRVEQRQIWPK